MHTCMCLDTYTSTFLSEKNCYPHETMFRIIQKVFSLVMQNILTTFKIMLGI